MGPPKGEAAGAAKGAKGVARGSVIFEGAMGESGPTTVLRRA